MDKNEAVVPRVAPLDIHEATPALGWYSDHVLFHHVWNRPGLSRRKRSLVTVSALVTRGHFAQLTGHFNRALDHGVAPLELVELVTHLAFYAGWPCAMSSVKVLREVFAARGIAHDGAQTIPLIDPVGDGGDTLAACLTDKVLPDLWQRKELALADRSLATLACLVAEGRGEGLAAEAERAREAGLTLEELREVLAHLAFYVGLPRVAYASGLLGL